jgi:3-methyladenine DNA glycosylase/8-oxoguanine DNA glycosylase
MVTGGFESLARGIVGQQISTRAATAIYDRLIDLIGGREPAQAIVTASDDELRLVGLSRAKMAALRDLAARMLDGRLELQRLDELTDAEVRSQLIAVRGIRHLGVSLKTIQNHVSNVLGKLHVVDRTQAAIRGREAGLG